MPRPWATGFTVTSVSGYAVAPAETDSLAKDCIEPSPISRSPLRDSDLSAA